MTEAKARRMGFKRLPMWEGYYPGEWRRQLKRPACAEYWHPRLPNVISRITYPSGSCARCIETREA